MEAFNQFIISASICLRFSLEKVYGTLTTISSGALKDSCSFNISRNKRRI